MYTFRLLLVVAFVASGVHADWPLSEYAVPAADSAMANQLYGIRSYQNPSSKVDVRVANGAVALVASVIASDSTEGYSANVGLLHPFTPDWATHNIANLSSVDFEYRNSANITEYLAVSFGSNAYSDEIADAGTVYELGISGTTALGAGTAWKKGTAPVADFATPKWWTDIPAGFPEDIYAVLSEVTNLRFSPKTLYTGSGTSNGVACTKCVTPTMSSLTLEIRKVVLVGIPDGLFGGYRPLSCVDHPVTLDRLFDDTRHQLGGSWFGYSDFDSTGASTDPARGSSTAAMALAAGDDSDSGSIGLKARLDKKVGGTWHKYAGWAAIGADFDSGLAFKPGTFNGISFHMSGGPISPSVKNVFFKVALEGVPDDAVHRVRIPTSMLATPGGDEICIYASLLRMPSNVQTDQFDFDPTRKIKRISWEARISDQDSLVDTATVEMAVSNVKLYGWLAGVGVSRRVATPGPAVGYEDGFLHLRGFESVASVDILALDGSRVASFAPASRVALRLSRGTWILAARGRDGGVAAQPFVVAGP